jgi:hypothetical protein
VNELFDKNNVLDMTVESEQGTTPDRVSTEKETAVASGTKDVSAAEGEKTG